MPLPRKIPFYLALPRGSLKAVLQTSGEYGNGTLVAPEWSGASLVKSGFGFSLWRQLSRSFSIPGTPSAAPSTKWRLWVCQPLSKDWRDHARTIRWMRRKRIQDPDMMFGPFTHDKILQMAGNRTDDDGYLFSDLLAPGGQSKTPWVLAGDDPVDTTLASYDPSDDDSANNVEPSEGSVFPA